MEFRSFETSWGAEILTDSTVCFRGQQQLSLQLADSRHPVPATQDGWFELQLSGIQPSATYCFVLTDGTRVPDPASRAQQDDVNGCSLVVDGSTANDAGVPGWKPWCMNSILAWHFHTRRHLPGGDREVTLAKSTGHHHD